MQASLKDKFAAQVSFLSGFPFLSGMTRITKEKLGYIMKKEKYTHGQNIVTEGESLNYIYLIESGEFEIIKTISLNKKRNAVYGKFLRSVSLTQNNNLSKVLNDKSIMLFSNNVNELHDTKNDTKLLPK